MNKNNPPKWALRFLELLYKERYREQIEGDLFELFKREPNLKKARWQFGWNTLRFLRLRYLKGVDDFEKLTTLAMIKNYLKVAVRTLIKQKSYSVINILGLAIGLSSCSLIFMYIMNERSYEEFYPDVDRIYRVVNGEKGRFTPPLLAQTMMDENSQIEVATRINGLYSSHFKIEDRSFVQRAGATGDPNVFEVFTTEFLEGDSKSALSEPNSIVLTSSLAKKCFPDEAAFGQVITVDGNVMKVSAVVVDPPKNTHFPYLFIKSKIQPDHSNWTGNSAWTYAKLQNGASVDDIEPNLQELYSKYVGPEIISYSGHHSFEAFIQEYPDRYYGFTLFPVRDIHLYRPHFSMGPSGDYKNVIIFSLIAFFILIIACVNYINMSTARSAIRSKEVGIRKALGSQRKSIIQQFLTESILITFIAILLSIVLSSASLTYFNELTGRSFTLGNLFSTSSLLSTFSLLIVVGLIAGAYPAYIISAFSPLKALRGQMQQAGKRSLRSSLVIFQFAISIFLVAATIVIYQQVNHMQSHELGLNLDQTLVINNGVELGEKYELFKNQLNQRSDVHQVAKASNIPFHGYGDWTYQIPEEDNLRTSPMNAFVEPGIEKVLDLEIAEGRFLEASRVTDTSSVVINESLVRELGWESPIGKRMTRGSGLDFTVVGVVKDFNYTSLKSEISPMILRYGNSSMEIGIDHQRYVLAKVSTQNILQTFREIEALWNEQVPGYPFDAAFLNDSFQREYEGEQKFGEIFITFSILAIFIAFLGLFALTTFVLQKRFKEIAVRKVLGASITSILRMILKDFTRLVLIGGSIGIAVSFYWLDGWLENYSYRIELTWYLLAIPVLLVLLLTWLLVSLKSYRVAVSNPSNALKDE